MFYGRMFCIYDMYLDIFRVRFLKLTGMYRNKEITWQQYVDRYLALVNNRHCETRFSEIVSNHSNICLLCTEPLPEQCHRRLLAEYLATKLPNVTIYHI